MIRDGKRGFRMVVGGGLGPLPVEAQLLDEFLPEERIVNRSEAVIRVFNQYGNRKNKNMARLKFVMRERGFEWLSEEIEKEYADILANGGIATPEMVPEGFGGYQSQAAAAGQRRAAAGRDTNGFRRRGVSIAGSNRTCESSSRPAMPWSRSASIRAT